MRDENLVDCIATNTDKKELRERLNTFNSRTTSALEEWRLRHYSLGKGHPVWTMKVGLEDDILFRSVSASLLLQDSIQLLTTWVSECARRGRCRLLSQTMFIPRPYKWAWSLNYPQVEEWVTTGKGSPKHCVLPALCVQEASYVTFLGNSVFPCHSTFPSNPLTKYICSFCKRNVGGGRETPGKKWAQAGRAGASQDLVSKCLVEQTSRKGIAHLGPKSCASWRSPWAFLLV